MLVPEILYGDSKSVMAACRKHVARFRRGASWNDIGALVDVKEVSGLIMLESPSPLLKGPNVRLYAPFWELNKAQRRAQEPRERGAADEVRVFDEAIGCAWGLLGLLSPLCYSLFKDQDRAIRFMNAVRNYWDDCDSVGQRYTTGLPMGESLWSAGRILKYALARAGVPKPVLLGALPQEGVAALLRSRQN